MILGITGTDGAGKGTVVEYLVSKYNFVHYSARNIFIEELNKRGQDTTRANMRLIGNEFREKYGNDFVVTHYLKKIEEGDKEFVIVDSVRTTAEAETLKKNGGILLAVDADQKIRYRRVQERRSETDQVTFDEFVQHEELETNDPHPHGMQKQKVIDMADYKIENRGSREELLNYVDKFMAELGV